MLLAGFVVKQDTFLQRVLDNFVGNFSSGFFAGMATRERSRDFEHVIGAAGIAARVGGDLLQNFV